MKLDWYFDFISPFAYLQHCQFDQLPSFVEVTYKPILFAGLLNHWGNIGPAEIPPKRIFTYQHCYWLANKNEIPFKMPPAHPFKSLNALRLAIACNCDSNVIGTIFETIWKHGYAIDSSDAIEYLEQNLKLANIDKLVASQAVKDKLRKNTQEAADKGIFGVPTFSGFRLEKNETKYENFWGLDSFEMMLDYVANPVSFFDDEMRRLEVLPEGVQRKPDSR